MYQDGRRAPRASCDLVIVFFVESEGGDTLGFFLVFAPMGFLLRLCSQDPMQRRLEPAAASYRVGRCESFESFSMIMAQGSALAPFIYTLF